MSFGFILLGLLAGALSGVVGIGGGVILVPTFVYLFKMPQHLAQGTTLALLVPPIGFLAAREYYLKQYVDMRIAALVCVGFFIGGLVGGKFAVSIRPEILKKIFGGYLLIIGLKMLLGK